MLRIALALSACLTPTLSNALCNGPSFWDTLSGTQHAEIRAQADQTPYASGNTWVATKGDRRLTIAGTLHLPDPRHGAVMARLTPALDTADLLLVEATNDDMIALENHIAQNPDLITLTGPSLIDLLEADTWATLSDAATARGLPPFMAAKMQPWFLGLTFAMPPCAMSALAAGDDGLDGLLLDAADARDIPTAALEPWTTLFDALSGDPFDAQIAALEISMIDPDIQDAMTVSLVDFYFAEQTAMGWFLTDFTKDYLPPDAAALFDAEFAKIEQALLVDRNIAWIPVINDASAKHSHVFVAFGAAHLFGDFGVLSLLAKDGWAISPF